MGNSANWEQAHCGNQKKSEVKEATAASIVSFCSHLIYDLVECFLYYYIKIYIVLFNYIF